MGAKRTRRIPGWLGNPGATAIILALMFAEQAVFYTGRPGQAFIPSVWYSFVPGRQRTTQPPGYVQTLYVVRDGDGLRVIDPESESWDELSALYTSSDSAFIEFSFRHTIERGGIWAHAYERRSWTVRQHAMGPWTQAQIAESRAYLSRVGKGMPAWHWLPQRIDVLDQDEHETDILWSGVARCAVGATLGLALVLSIAGSPAWFASKPWSRRNRRLRRGACPECAYDLRDVQSLRCPECGHALTDKEHALAKGEGVSSESASDWA